ncbi:hypothetical protein RSAG8_05315, partial [Rhizoctonia solani AG-8 WAC10335]
MTRGRLVRDILYRLSGRKRASTGLAAYLWNQPTITPCSGFREMLQPQKSADPTEQRS